MSNLFEDISRSLSDIVQTVQNEIQPQQQSARSTNAQKTERKKVLIKNDTSVKTGGDKSNTSDRVKKTREKIKTSADDNNNNVNYNSNNLDFSNMTKNELIRGVILSEVLGKPRSRRRGRW
jgi:hypothetical protein